MSVHDQQFCSKRCRSGSGDSQRDRRLARIAHMLESAHHATADTDASLVRIANLDGTDTDELELAVLPLEPHEVFEFLLGVTTPAHWDVAGLVVSGQARSLEAVEGSGVSGSARCVVLCDRDGTMVSVIRVNGDDPVCRVDPPGEGPLGRLSDALRRSLALPTPPPPVSPAQVSALVWLHRVHTVAVRGEAVDLALVEALRPTKPTEWSEFLLECRAGAWPELECSAEIAAWMDEGMFARWCLEAFPEPLELLVELTELVSPVVATHIGREVVGAVASSG